MTPLVRELIDTLKSEAGLYRDLLKLSEEQKAILVANKLEGLQENVKKQEKVMFSIGPLSDARIKTLEKIGRQTGLKEATVAALANRLPQADGQELRSAAKGLMDVVHDLDALNKVNGKLLENAQAYAKFTVEAMQGTATILPGDPSHVKVERSGGSGLFNKVV